MYPVQLHQAQFICFVRVGWSASHFPTAARCKLAPSQLGQKIYVLPHSAQRCVPHSHCSCSSTCSSTRQPRNAYSFLQQLKSRAQQWKTTPRETPSQHWASNAPGYLGATERSSVMYTSGTFTVFASLLLAARCLRSLLRCYVKAPNKKIGQLPALRLCLYYIYWWCTLCIYSQFKPIELSVWLVLVTYIKLEKMLRILKLHGKCPLSRSLSALWGFGEALN